MEAMRKWLSMSAALFVLAFAVAGCKHTAGKCDCCGDGCAQGCTSCSSQAPVIHAAPVAQPAPIAMPK